MAAVLDSIPRPAQTGFPRIDAERMIRDHLALPQHVRDGWRKLVQSVVADRQVEQLHAERDKYQQIVREWIDQLRGFVDFCRRVGASTPGQPGVLAQAEQGLADLQAFHDTLFGEWQTLDDLYRIAVREFQLPTEKLKAYADANPIPQSWYDEDVEGLFADDEPAP